MGMTEAFTIGKTLFSMQQNKAQERAIANQAALSKAANETAAAKERLNSQKRQAERLEEFKRIQAHNAVQGGGIDRTTGSSINISRTALGKTNKANYDDIFNTDLNVTAINTSSNLEQQGYAAKRRAKRYDSMNTLLSGFESFI